MTKRVIARLDVKGDNVVRGMHLEGLRIVGQPEEMAARYADAGIDEIVFIDTVASLYGRNNMLPVVERTAEKVFIPMTVGGGVRSVEDVREMLRAGADKVAMNSGAVRNPKLITEVAEVFGAQCVVISIEVQQQAPGKWAVMIENGRETTGLDAIAWAKQAHSLGAGEIILTSIDQDGMRKGCDLPLTRAVAEAVPIPVIASGGPGKVEHVVSAFQEGKADAVALGTLLHFKLSDVASVKHGLAAAGIPVRPNA